MRWRGPVCRGAARSLGSCARQTAWFAPVLCTIVSFPANAENSGRAEKHRLTGATCLSLAGVKAEGAERVRMNADYVIVLTTIPADADGHAFAYALVDDRLAACVNLLPPMESVYRWEGRVERETERQVVIKTS